MQPSSDLRLTVASADDVVVTPIARLSETTFGEEVTFGLEGSGMGLQIECGG
jgi:hypothetical protein